MTGRPAIAVLGAGSWGTALAIHLAGNGHPVTLWGHRPQHLRQLAATRTNPAHLPGITLPDAVQPEADLTGAILRCDELILATPSHAMGDMLTHLAALPTPPTRIMWTCKGFEHGSGRFFHQLARQTLPDLQACACLSGPTFAGEVARGLPTAMTVGADDTPFANQIARWFASPTFRVYTSTDLIGVQLGGAVKNILAIAAGIADGLGFGANSRSALITRGLVEIIRLGETLGARVDTLMGLSGLGDLVLTCTDNQSRNRRYGLAIGRGANPQAAAHAIGQTIEGLSAARAVRHLMQQHDIDMPISHLVACIVFDALPPRAAVNALFQRDIKPEDRMADGAGSAHAADHAVTGQS